MEEILYKFIDEGRREHEEMGAFIIEFKTTNDLLLKERNNSLSELEFEVYGLSKAISSAHLSNYEVKGVTTRGGKTTTEIIRDTNDINKEPPILHHDKPVEPNEVLIETKPQETKEQTIQPPTPLIPFPHMLKKEKEEAQQRKFLENLKQLHINIPFTEALSQMPKYAKFLKGLLSNKTRLEEACIVTMNKRCSAVLLNKLPSKEKDPGSFTIPCDIGHLHINNALEDLGASISLMPYTMYEKLGLGEPKPTRMSLELADRSIQYPRGISENVLIKIDKFILPIIFVILDMREDFKIPIILGRPFLETARAMIDVFNKKITLRVGNEEVIFDVDQSIKRPPADDDECYGIDFLDTTIHLKTQELLEDDQLDSFMVNNLEESIDLSDLESCGKADNNFEFRTPIRRIEEVLEKCKGAIAWKMSDIKGISPSFCTHKILTEESFKPVIQPQRRLNPKVQDVVKNKIVKLLDSGLIYLISDRFFQIPIAPEDQEKMAFTCPYGTFAYKRMPFGLCNAPATFQRCMTTIFHDMVEDFMEVFIDDFSIKKGAENLAINHLSRLENPNMGELAKDEIADKFPDEHLMILKANINDEEPWGNKYILVAVDYVSKWVEAQVLPTNVACAVVKFLKGLFARFRVPKALISDRGTHFCNSQLEKALFKYEVTHKTSKTYHPQTNRQTKVTNRAIKRILERSVGYNPKDWSEKLNHALWAFRTAYKTPTGCTPFKIVYGKACHLPVEIEHKAYWALKQCNMDFTSAAKNRFMELNELMELRDRAYENLKSTRKEPRYGMTLDSAEIKPL
ncbi:reverse transcriptase domain-containing protein [Tanacetum coccineum]